MQGFANTSAWFLSFGIAAGALAVLPAAAADLKDDDLKAAIEYMVSATR